MSMSPEFMRELRTLRDEGFVVIVWTPEEVGDCPPSVLEDLSIQRGWDVINDFNEDPQ